MHNDQHSQHNNLKQKNLPDTDSHMYIAQIIILLEWLLCLPWQILHGKLTICKKKTLLKRQPLAQLIKGLLKTTCLDVSKKYYNFYFTTDKACGY
jgi:hypothetical protein